MKYLKYAIFLLLVTSNLYARSGYTSGADNLGNREADVNQIKTDTGTVRTDLTTETSNRSTGDSNLGIATGTINTDLLNVKTDTGTLRTDLTSEITNRQNADATIGLATSTIQTDLSSVKTDTGTLRTDLTTETSNRTSADSAISLATGTLDTNKYDKTGGVITGSITVNGNYTGNGSGLTYVNADKLDSYNYTAFVDTFTDLQEIGNRKICSSPFYVRKLNLATLGGIYLGDYGTGQNSWLLGQPASTYTFVIQNTQLSKNVVSISTVTCNVTFSDAVSCSTFTATSVITSSITSGNNYLILQDTVVVKGNLDVQGKLTGDGSALTGIVSGAVSISTSAFSMSVPGDLYVSSLTATGLGQFLHLGSSITIVEVGGFVCYNATNTAIIADLHVVTSSASHISIWDSNQASRLTIATSNYYAVPVSTFATGATYDVAKGKILSLHLDTVGNSNATGGTGNAGASPGSDLAVYIKYRKTFGQ